MKVCMVRGEREGEAGSVDPQNAGERDDGTVVSVKICPLIGD